MVYLESVFLLFGLFLLSKSSDMTVKYASMLSSTSNISHASVGFLFIGLATSLPEIFVGIISIFNNHQGIILGNLIGSNITNLTLVLGIMIFVGLKKFNKGLDHFIKALMVAIAVSIVILTQQVLTIYFGALILIAFYFISKNILLDGKAEKLHENKDDIFLLLGSVTLLIMSAYIVTENAVRIAEFFNLSNGIIGASIIAAGTSLPEIAVSISAIKSNKISIAIGNITGSVVVNLTLALGIILLFTDLVIGNLEMTLSIILIMVSLFIGLLLKYFKISKKYSILLFLIYLTYLYFIIF